ncbi:MAG TPA: 1,4-dihydroxy-2-naphthoate prenyltransferase [Rheinheimera sp.]|uniref:prenyltransferase n=1 Tax=Rheinheimera sp. TaxID=1869214 RepID=UPI000EC97971|nr:prenyltransferase [Rheinheimera sp.]HCU65730.1 1,4-dihydroxy-2-naphthoate prenyltransferase [Rheinheimera sp.]
MFKVLLGVSRWNFLSLTVLTIALAAVTARYQGAEIQQLQLGLVLLLALCAHISVNAFNEYFDFRSGLDLLTSRTPFSGGSGTLPQQPAYAGVALLLALVTLLLVIGIGLYLTWQLGGKALWIGIPGVLLLYGYTQYLQRSPLLCLLAPGVGFGVLMFLGALWALGAQLTAGAGVIAVILLLLCSNLLLLNQFPDVEADRQVGRRHLPIVWGLVPSAKLFAAFYLLAYLLLALAVWFGLLPRFCLAMLLTLPVFLLLWQRINKALQHNADLVPALALNVLLVHLCPLLLLLALYWSNTATV